MTVSMRFSLTPISIPAPARGATLCLDVITLNGSQFQFPPLREGQPITDWNTRAPILFQFPPLREGQRHIRLLW